MRNDCIPVIIPAYEPDDRFIELAIELNKSNITNIIVVNDGSGEEYFTLFSRVQEILGKKCVILTHEINKGKGAALKTAFSYVIEHIPSAVGVVTADCDGQHDVTSLCQIQKALLVHPDKLILGVREFNGEDIPWKSQFGNNITRIIFRYVSGVDIKDTQTGLRGIPRKYLDRLTEIKYNRFEYEMKMLVYFVCEKNLIQIPIKTIYESKENHQTHFNPLIDSIKIYRILCTSFLRFIFSSLSSSVIDLVLFSLFCMILRSNPFYIFFSTLFSRILSATYNCVFNYKLVFASKTNISLAIIRYTILAVTQMLMSAALVSVGVMLLKDVNETVIKIIVDSCLFFISYKIQQKYVYGD